MLCCPGWAKGKSPPSAGGRLLQAAGRSRCRSGAGAQAPDAYGNNRQRSDRGNRNGNDDWHRNDCSLLLLQLV